MNPTDTLTTLFQHHLWANLTLFERCAALTDDELEATIPGAFGSIYKTLQHIATSERSYFSRISTGLRYPGDDRPATIAEMIDLLRQTGLGLIEWVPKIRPTDAVEVDWDGTPRNAPKTILLTQALQHAAEHREQIKAIMTEIGIEPPDLQGWEFFDAADTRGLPF
jgi:uncharacterized damage-inducible protein DinB